MSKIDWNRWNNNHRNDTAKEWPGKDFDWSGRATVPDSLGPHARKKALMVGLSPVFAFVAMVGVIGIAEPEAAKTMFSKILFHETNAPARVTTAHAAPKRQVR